MAIRWRNQDIKKLQTYTRKFNAAITRLEKSAPDLVGTGALPQRISSPDLKARILNRNDFNRELRRIDRFFKKGSRDIIRDKDGFYTTRWQEKELKYLEQRVNRQKRAYIEKYQVPKAQQQFLGLTDIDISKEKQKIIREANKLEDIDDRINKLQEWYNLAYTVEQESSADYLAESFAKLRSAYFNAINKHLPEDKAKELIDYLKDNNVWGSDIVWAIAQNDILDFEYFYSTDDAMHRAEVMLDRWKKMMPELKKQDSYQDKKKKGETVP